MLEPAVTLTNAALVLECWAFALALRGGADPNALLPWFRILFAALGLGALLGGVTHGYLPDTAAGLGRAVWSGNLLSLGLAGASAGMIAARIALSPSAQRRFGQTLGLLGLAYGAVVIFLTQDFLLALAASVPLVLFLLVVLVGLARRAGGGRLWLAAAGLVLNLLAGVQQQMQIGIDSVWFNHNALFHLIEMAAFLLIFLGARPVALAAPQPGSRA